jgi:hypothetical protein
VAVDEDEALREGLLIVRVRVDNAVAVGREGFTRSAKYNGGNESETASGSAKHLRRF